MSAKTAEKSEPKKLNNLQAYRASKRKSLAAFRKQLPTTPEKK